VVNGEITLASVDDVTRQLVVRRLRAVDGAVCGPSFTVYTGGDARHVSVSSTGDHWVVIWRAGSNDPDAQNTVYATVLARQRG
jgi:hypothetical protein